MLRKSHLNRFSTEKGKKLAGNWLRCKVVDVSMVPIDGPKPMCDAILRTTYLSEVNYLKTFLTNRLLWMDDALGTITAIENSQNVSRLQNYPNPVGQQTTISYSLPKAGLVKLSVYDVFGRKVETVVEAEQVVDSYEILYSTQNLPSGMYIYSLQLDNNVLAVRKLIISKH